IAVWLTSAQLSPLISLGHSKNDRFSILALALHEPELPELWLIPVATGNAKAALPTFQPGKYPAVPLGVVSLPLTVGVTGQGKLGWNGFSGTTVAPTECAARVVPFCAHCTP